MRNLERIRPLLKLIEKIWIANPDLRLCQLIGNCFVPTDLYNVEDDELRKALQRCYSIREE